METPHKRKRLSKKQVWFLNNVFDAGQTVTDALGDLRIRPATLDRWLTHPLFLNRLRMHLNHYYLQARMELARSASLAVSGLAFLSEKSLKHAELRRACNDILNLHARFAKIASSSNPKQRSALEGFTDAAKGTVADKVGVLLEQFGVVLDKDRSNNTPQNRLLNIKNEEITPNLTQRVIPASEPESSTEAPALRLPSRFGD